MIKRLPTEPSQQRLHKYRYGVQLERAQSAETVSYAGKSAQTSVSQFRLQPSEAKEFVAPLMIVDHQADLFPCWLIAEGAKPRACPRRPRVNRGDRFFSLQKLLKNLVRDQVGALRNANPIRAPFDPPFLGKPGNGLLPLINPRAPPASAGEREVHSGALPQAQEKELLKLLLGRQREDFRNR